MESGEGVRMKTAIASSSGSRFLLIQSEFTPHRISLRTKRSASVTPPQGGSDSLFCSGLGTDSWAGVFMDSGVTKKMKIIQFPENIDKFPTNFDKFLKTNGEGIEQVINIISVGYENRFKQKMNILSKFIE